MRGRLALPFPAVSARKMISGKDLKSLRYALQPSINFMKNWGRPLSAYGAGAALLAIYLIDWRIVATRIPFYRKKFEEKTIE
ncbi:hypothetical protein EGR_02724 [Echinococcus granulosus]|uniref:Cytochrome b-c1 complex subunit 10 n=2 Tax=Echinococcus granulosus TaxID=6210 RepID=W6UMA6_ECHGR|nr:hypothetical protein EGR_02724 [Echinococcus granulosus]EUB62271.1 hypothetical protein EGR_02724 [Echinococcus granulosus]